MTHSLQIIFAFACGKYRHLARTMNNLNDEDFNNPDSWLSEQFFTHLREFNNEYKVNPEFTELLPNYESSDIITEYSIGTQSFNEAALRVEPFDAVFSKNLSGDTFEIKPELLDLSFRPIEQTPVPYETLAYDSSLYPPQALDLTSTTAVQLLSTCTETAIDEIQQEAIDGFDSAEEELKLLRYLEEDIGHPPVCKNEPNNCQLSYNNNANVGTEIYVLQDAAPVDATVQQIFNCINCNNFYDAETIQNHVCISVSVVPTADDVKPKCEEVETIIPEVQPVEEPVEELEKEPENVEPLLPVDPSCIRLLKENQIRIRRFLKDMPKCDAYVNSLIAKGNLDSLDSASSSAVDTTPNSSYSSLHNSAIKKQEGPHECTLCERKFVHASGLLRHMEKHALDLIPTTTTTGGSNKPLYPQLNSSHNANGLRVVIKCTICGRIFFEESSAFMHMNSHFPKRLKDELEMDNCADGSSENFLDDALYMLHQEIDEGFYNEIAENQLQETKVHQYLKMVILSCILQCEFCDFVFSDVSYLFVHSSCHLPERRFECFSCNIHIKTSKEICNHWQAECVFMRENLKVYQAITQRYFVCNVCENKFQSMDLLHEHRYTSYHFFPRYNRRLGILKLPCEYCETICDNAHDCVTHYEDKHYRRYKRGEKEGSTGGSNKTRQYLCDICGKSYTQSSHLWQHLRFHQGVKPFACKEPGCNRKFTIRPDLNDHIRKCHTGERPYHCLICGKRFLTGSVFYQHRLIHRGERRYECEECGKRFYRADALKNHQRIHTGEKPFGCLFCTKNFRQRGDRDKHIRARHSHLDANARIMMQMQKLQLEAAAAAAQQSSLENTTSANESLDALAAFSAPYNNIENIDPSSSVYCNGDTSGHSENSINIDLNNDIVMIGSVAFPRSMIESIMMDIDEETVLKAMQINGMNLPLN